MKPLSELLTLEKKSGPTSEYAEAIEKVLEFMGEDNWGKWCGRLKRFKDRPHVIHEMIRQAKEGRSPQALFQYLIRR